MERPASPRVTCSNAVSVLNGAAADNPSADFATVFTNAKAGMEGLSDKDREHIKKTIYDMSKDSAHFKNEQRKQAQVEAKITALRAHAASVSASEMGKHQRAMEQKLAVLEAGRDLSRTWIHVDMDAFYASVEQLFNPDLAHVPMAVGGIGMISTANYPARKFGVRSAMPGFIAKVLCPQLVFVPLNFERYTEYSQKTRHIFQDYDSSFESASLDEAYLDVTDFCSQTGMTGAQVAEALRSRVREETKLTCSCGVAANKMLAKICSDLHKPDGQFVLPSSREAVMTFIDTLPVRKIPGIGRVTEQILAAFGVKQCGHILKNVALLSAILTPCLLDFAVAAGLGLGQTRHSPPQSNSEPHRKGISCERTFKPISSKDQLETMAASLVQHLCSDMAGEDIQGRTITLKLKAATFEVRTRAVTLSKYVSRPEEMLPAVIKLLHAELPISARLMGIRMSNLRKSSGKASGPLLRYFQQQPVHAAAEQQQQQPVHAAAEQQQRQQRQQRQRQSEQTCPGADQMQYHQQGMSPRPTDLGEQQQQQRPGSTSVHHMLQHQELTQQAALRCGPPAAVLQQQAAMPPGPTAAAAAAGQQQQPCSNSPGPSPCAYQQLNRHAPEAVHGDMQSYRGWSRSPSPLACRTMDGEQSPVREHVPGLEVDMDHSLQGGMAGAQTSVYYSYEENDSMDGFAFEAWKDEGMAPQPQEPAACIPGPVEQAAAGQLPATHQPMYVESSGHKGGPCASPTQHSGYQQQALSDVHGARHCGREQREDSMENAFRQTSRDQQEGRSLQWHRTMQYDPADSPGWQCLNASNVPRHIECSPTNSRVVHSHCASPEQGGAQQQQEQQQGAVHNLSAVGHQQQQDPLPCGYLASMQPQWQQYPAALPAQLQHESPGPKLAPLHGQQQQYRGLSSHGISGRQHLGPLCGDAVVQPLEQEGMLSGCTAADPYGRHNSAAGHQQQLGMPSVPAASQHPQHTDVHQHQQPVLPSRTDAAGRHHDQAGGKRTSAASWTCQACTFADNKPQILRCAICDTLKGMDYRAPAALGAHSMKGGKTAGIGAKKKGKGGKANAAMSVKQLLRTGSAST